MYGSVVAAHLISGRRPVFGIVRRRPAGVRCQRAVLMSHLHQLFGVRQNIAMVIGAVPVEQRPCFVGIDDAFVSAARFRRQLRAGEGVGYTVQRRGGALHHMAVHTGLIAVGLVIVVKMTAVSAVSAGKLTELTTSGVLTPGPSFWVTTTVALPLASVTPRYSVWVVVSSVSPTRTGLALLTTPAVFRIFTADDKRRVAFGRAVARFGGDGEGDALPYLHF